MQGVAPAVVLAEQARLGQLPPGSIGNEIAEQKAALKVASKEKDAALAAQNTGFGPKRPHPVIIVKPRGKPVGGRTRRRFKKKRLMSRAYCKKTPCRRMGFTQKASCRPYKNCYTRRK